MLFRSLPGCDLAGAATIAARFVDAVRALQVPHARSATAPHVTVSVGVAALEVARDDDLAQAAAKLLADADAALYEAKRGGRDQVRAP